jgi:polygalacturonase
VNDHCYYNDFGYHVFLNGKEYYKNYNYNIISLYGLNPGTTYALTVYSTEMEELGNYDFTTREELICFRSGNFGAKGDGKTDDTVAIQTAVNSCPSNGRVLIEPGIYYVGPLFFKSNITLDLAKGAVLLAHTKRTHYPVLPDAGSEDRRIPSAYTGTWEGEAAPMFASLITGFNLENFAVVGEGVIDGNAQNGDWWINPKEKRIAWRPRLIFLAHCKNIILHGLTLKNSPSWTIHPFFTDQLDLINLNIINPKDSPNTDGINPESCEDVNIIGSSISVGDDCIAVKSGKLEMGTRFKKPTRNLTVRNCLMKHGHGAIVLGSEMSGGIQDLCVSKCRFIDTDRGLRIKTRRGRGKYGIIDNIIFENIRMNGVLTPFVINMHYFCDLDGKTDYVQSREKFPVDHRTPHLKSFFFHNIECSECEVAALFFIGLPEQKIGSVSLENIKVSFKSKTRKNFPAMMCGLEPTEKLGIYINQAKRVFMKNIKISGNSGDVYQLHNIDDLDIVE